MSIKNIWEVCNLVENYKTKNSNGIDWTDPKNSAWTNFSWFDSAITEQQRTYIKNRWNYYTKQGDAGKLIFFDLINLAPTTEENYGYHSTNLPMTTKGYFFTGLDSNAFKNVKYISTGRFKRLLSHEQNEVNHQSESDFQKIIKNQTKIDEDSMKHPAQSEFKLPWMRNLVEAGVEGQMGPFIQSGKHPDGRRQFTVNKSILDMFLKNYGNYKEAIWQAWLKEEELNTDRQSIFAKISKTDLNKLRNNQPLDSSGEEDFVLTELALGSDKKTPITVRGVMPKITKTSKENFVVSGWIRLPEIYGNRQLPWPFVWKYIVRGGIWQKSEWKAGQTYMAENVSVVYKTDILSQKSNDKNAKYFVSFGTGKTPSAVYLSYDARARFWHFRYSSGEMPDRELFFWIRYLNGFSGAVGARYVAATSPPALRLLPEVKLEESFIIQCGGVPLSGVSIDARPGINAPNPYLPYDRLYKLRSKYVSRIHDTVGWNRYSDYGDEYVLPKDGDSGFALEGKPTEIVDFSTKSGYYSFTGGGSDRSAVSVGKTDLGDDYIVYDYKKEIKLDVKKNDIPLYPLFKIEKNDEVGLPSPGDRFLSPDYRLSASTVKTIYHNHSNKYTFNFKDAFNPGTLTAKEIQFFYELVSFVFYGKVDSVGYRTIFDRDYITNNFHRWKELRVQNGFKINDARESGTATYLMDYISWAAPTNEQYYKKKYSEITDTFVYRYKQMESTILSRNELGNAFKVHSLAKNIYDSENSNRPMVPAWVHYKYISRLTNTGEYGLGVDIDDDPDVFRVLGGKNRDGVGQGKLIALPMFVLGGRPDIPGGDKDNWDYTWGKVNPFSMENGILKVNELDEVIDSWAKGKLHNGKYVSAMEIAFWIRYKHGFASSPDQRNIKWYIEDFNPAGGTKIINYKSVETDKNYWPKEAFIYENILGTRPYTPGTTPLKAGDVLPTETLHNIPILVSYYHPIYSDGAGDSGVILSNADPLMDMKTNERLPGNPKTAFTGWNSKYVCHWPGAKELPSDSLQESTFFQSVSSLFSLNYPGNITTINLYHVNPFKRVLETYLQREKTFKYDSKYGLKFGFSIDKIINTSDVQAWFRAQRIIQIHDAYSKYIAEGMEKSPGTRGSVIPVLAEVYDDKKNETSDTIVFISGDTFGKRYTGDEDFTEENLIIKPWVTAFNSNDINSKGQPELDSMYDDYYLGTKQCIPQYRYMKHIIQAVDFMYFSPKIEGKGWHSPEQSTKTVKYLLDMMYLKSHLLGNEYGVNIENVLLNNEDLRNFVFGGLSSVSEISSKILPKGKEKTVSIMKSLNTTIRTTGKIGKIIWTASALGTKVKTIGTAYFDFLELQNVPGGIGPVGLISGRAKNLEDFFKFKLDLPLHYLKLITKLLSSSTEDMGYTLTYIGKEISQKVVGDIIKDASKHAFAAEIEAILNAVVVTEFGAARALRLARIASLANFGITALFELISWQADLAMTNAKQEEKIEKMWKLLNDASKAGYVEGPYLESKGAIRIKKGTDGTIEGNYTIDSNGNVELEKGTPSQDVNGDGFWEGPVPGYDQPQEPQTQDTLLNQYIKRHNDKFYKPGGLADKIGANLKANSCECRFLVDLFADTPEFKSDPNFKYPDKGNPYSRKNWKEGPFRRQWKQRDGIVNNAPVYSDIPITFRKNPSPNIDVEYFPFESESRQVSFLQTPGDWVNFKGKIRRNIRVNGQNGTQVNNMDDCPRFWWPNILHISPSDDLCSYMAIDGNYPTKNPEIYKLCDQFSAYQLRNRLANERNKTSFNTDVKQYARSIFTPGLPIPYTDVTSGDLNIDKNNSNVWDVENKVQFGNTIFSLQGVAGIAPPHEREIVRLFRMKYGIEIVNPKNNCCSIGEVLEEEPSQNSQRELSSKQKTANGCEYIINLNTKRFREIVKSSCKANTQNDDSRDPIEDERSPDPIGIRMPDISEIDEQILSGILKNAFDTIPIGGWDDNRRRRKSRRKTPCIPPMLCDDNEIPIPPDVVTGPRPPAIEEEDRKPHPQAEADLNRGVRVGSAIGKVVGQGVGGIVKYLTPESRVTIKKFLIDYRATPLTPAEKRMEYIREDIVTNIWTGEQRSEFIVIDRLEYEQNQTGIITERFNDNKNKWKEYMESRKKTR
jgi:hypothetical protein